MKKCYNQSSTTPCPVPDSKPRPRDFATFNDYSKAHGKYCYDNNIGCRGPSFNRACWVIDWVRQDFPCYDNLFHQGTGEPYVPAKHRI